MSVNETINCFIPLFHLSYKIIQGRSHTARKVPLILIKDEKVTCFVHPTRKRKGLPFFIVIPILVFKRMGL